MTDLPPEFRPGARIEMEIPANHPYLQWLHQHQHELMDNGGLMPHGVLTVSLGGVEQRYDLVRVDYEGYRQDAHYQATWRMYGDPT
jgi:hypothetical protein